MNELIWWNGSGRAAGPGYPPSLSHFFLFFLSPPSPQRKNERKEESQTVQLHQFNFNSQSIHLLIHELMELKRIELFVLSFLASFIFSFLCFLSWRLSSLGRSHWRCCAHNPLREQTSQGKQRKEKNQSAPPTNSIQWIKSEDSLNWIVGLWLGCLVLQSHLFISFRQLNSFAFFNWKRKRKETFRCFLLFLLVFFVRSMGRWPAHNPPKDKGRESSSIPIAAASPVNNSLSSARPLGRASCNESWVCWMGCGLSYRAPLSLSIIYLFVHS